MSQENWPSGQENEPEEGLNNEGAGLPGNDPSSSSEHDEKPKPFERFIFRRTVRHYITGKLIFPRNGRFFRIPVDQDGNPVRSAPKKPRKTDEDPEGSSIDN